MVYRDSFISKPQETAGVCVGEVRSSRNIDTLLAPGP